MSDYPPQVEELRQAILSLPGVAACQIGLKELQQYSLRDLSLPGEFADLPHAAMYRTRGGLEHEALIQVEIIFWQRIDGWIATEFLAWWVRDQSRGGETMQFRALALPPEGFQRQLGNTLKFVLELFFINPTDAMEPILERVKGLAADLRDSAEVYRTAINDPVGQSDEPAIW